MAEPSTHSDATPGDEPGRTGSAAGGITESLDLLEQRIRSAADTIAALRRERAELESALAERDARITELEDRKTVDEDAGARLAAVAAERDGLLRDRTATAGRVEALVQRLESLGLE